MGKEIERKWVLHQSYAPEWADMKDEAIVQAYLITNPGELRIRRKGEKHYITVKGDGTISRDEWEQELPEWAFKQLLPTAIGQLTKTRYTIDGQLELDVYGGRLSGLQVLEVEFPDEATAANFTPPFWCKVRREVTEDPRFKNKNLALAEAIPEL